MSRESSPYIRGDLWLDKRRDGKAPNIWQIARKERGTVIYRSTHQRVVADARAVLDAHADALQSKAPLQDPTETEAVWHLVNYWKEHGRKLVNHDQTARSLRTFIGFLMQDSATVHAAVTDLTPVLFERFREWRMGKHGFVLEWAGQTFSYSSDGVAGATVQRNVNDIRAAIGHAQSNLRVTMAPKIRDLDARYKSKPRERVLTIAELGQIAWYARHNPDLFRFVALMVGSAVRPQAALKFDPATQFNRRTGLIDLQPEESPQTKKRNAIIPAIRPLRAVLAADIAVAPVSSRKTAWRIMRRSLGLSEDVQPKTIRHTIATMLYADSTVPEREIVEMMGHEGNLARTTRIYAKYDPARLQNVVRSLTTIWREVSREARRFGADHSLTTTGKGGKNIVVQKGAEC